MKRPVLNPLWPLILIGTLSACGGGSSPGSGVAAPGAEAATLSEQIQTFEASGRLSALDRSSGLRGPDRDDNGIRDDIDAWIMALPVTDQQKKAAQQMARVHQAEILVDLNDKDTLQALGDQSMAAVKCLRVSFMPDFQKGYDLGSQIEAMTANTRARARQYLAYSRAVSGSSGRLPEGDTCKP